MHISALRVRNFRNFRALDIDPFPRNAVVVGENGTGKSNLLEALRLVLDPSMRNQSRRLKITDVCEASLATTPLADLEIRVEVELQGFDGDESALSEFDGWIISKDPLTARISYLWRRVRTRYSDEGDALDADATDFEWVIFGGTEEARDARRAAREIPLTVLPALRDAVRDLEHWRTSPLASIVERRPPAESVITAALASIGQATDKIAADVELKNTGSRLATRLASMSGQHLKITPTMGVAASRAEQLVQSLRLYIDTVRSRSVSDTSTGGANVVYMALLLERLWLQTEDDAQIDFVLGVEEPEAHLHPTLQRQLFGFLLQEYSKLVLTTHSPHIAAVADLRSLILLRRDPVDNVSLARTIHAAQLSTQELSDLERYVDVSRAEFLFAKAVILVEGIADVYALRGMAMRRGFDLDSWGVVIANVQGTDFAPFRALLGAAGFDVPHVVVTDGDSATGRLWLGFERAVELLPPEPAQAVREAIADLRAGTSVDTDKLYEHCAAYGVHVGTHTLEVDICPLFGDELAAAIKELLSPQATTDPHARVAAIRASNTAATRKDLLNAVDNVSKGRLGQRLAAHIEEASDGHAYVTMQAGVVASNPARYLIDALNAVCVIVGRDPLVA